MVSILMSRPTPARSKRALVPVGVATPDSEKLTINLGHVDLGQIDLLISEGFYSHRSDFIRTAIRNQLTSHAAELRDTTARRMLVLGLHSYGRSDLEALGRRGETLHLRVLGLLRFGADVTPQLARKTIASIVLLGAMQASPAVRAALADRMH
jgi:Arc/MetJ-type ribon-helix-helix transcriptional regulator